MRGNYLKFYTESLLYNCSFIMITGTVIQSFMLEYGIGENAVSVYASVMSLFQVGAMLLISKFVENMKNIIKSYALSVVMQTVLFVCLIFFSINTSSNWLIAYIAIFAASIVTNIFRGAQSVLCYKVPYHIIDMKNYGSIISISGILNSIAGVAVSTFMSFVLAQKGYFSTMSLFFLFGMAAQLMSCMTILRYKPIDLNVKKENTENKKINIWRYKPFLIFIIPNLLRGFCSGVWSLAMMIGYNCNVVSTTDAGIMVTLLQIATVLGSLVYSFLSRGNREGKILLISSIGVAVCMPLTLISGNNIVFLAVYFIACFMIAFVDLGVPVAVTKFVDYDCIGQYSAWRMALHTGGMALGSAVAAMLLNIFGGIGTMLIAGIFQFISGLSYYIYMKTGVSA